MVRSTPTSFHRHRRLISAGILLAVLSCAAVAADIGARNSEMNRLLDAIERSEAAVVAGRDRILDSAEAAAQSEKQGTPAQRKAFFRAVREEAGAAAVEVIDASDQVSDVRVLPWHSHLREAKRKYLKHAAAWEEELSSGAKQPEELLMQTPEITATFRIALRSLRAAKPPSPFGGGFTERINALDR